jgi:hypothetical protein
MTSDLLTAIQIACLVLLAIGAPAYAVLRLYWRAEAAEYALRNERLKSSRLEREVQLLLQALAAARRRDTMFRTSAPAVQGADISEADAERLSLQGSLFTPGGPASTLGTYSSS